jgi:hypothetical protein
LKITKKDRDNGAGWWGTAENSGESKVKGMIKEIRCNEETKHESEKAKKKIKGVSAVEEWYGVCCEKIRRSMNLI